MTIKKDFIAWIKMVLHRAEIRRTYAAAMLRKLKCDRSYQDTEDAQGYRTLPSHDRLLLGNGSHKSCDAEVSLRDASIFISCDWPALSLP
jgi:hypothetical protein